MEEVKENGLHLLMVENLKVEVEGMINIQIYLFLKKSSDYLVKSKQSSDYLVLKVNDKKRSIFKNGMLPQIYL